MNATANKPQSKTLNVISTMNEKLLEMNMKVWRKGTPECKAWAVNAAEFLWALSEPLSLSERHYLGHGGGINFPQSPKVGIGFKSPLAPQR